MKEKDINSLDHTTWRCQYHVVFAPKYRRLQEYIKNQLTEDQIADQLGIKEFVDPFTGSVNQKA